MMKMGIKKNEIKQIIQHNLEIFIKKLANSTIFKTKRLILNDKVKCLFPTFVCQRITIRGRLQMYIDGVFSGGGIKGLAYIGAYQALEEKGFKFKRVAGTSAGAIIAALIAAGFNSEEMYEELDKLELTMMLDEPKTFIPLKVLKWIPIYWRLGMYKGQALENWFDQTLQKKGVRTFGDLPPGVLRIIASDLSNGRILVLPNDLYKYNIPFESFPIAKAIRMSCSLPYFFEPVRIKMNQRKIIIVDGGVLSNFPMWLFDQENVIKERPVLGIKLSPNNNERPPKEIKNALQMFEALFSTMKDAHDSRYISQKHVKNIIFIPTDGLLTTEFGITEEGKSNLIELGRERTLNFLKKWTF